MTKALFLDDIRIPKDVYEYIKNDIYLSVDWDIVRNYNDFVQYITDINGTYVHAREGINNRFFHLDSVKKSKKQIKNAKVLKKKIKKNGKKVKDTT